MGNSREKEHQEVADSEGRLVWPFQRNPCLSAGRTRGHQRMGLHHEGQGSDRSVVGHQLRKAGEVHAYVSAPGQDHVQVGVRDGELVPHDVLLATAENMLLQVLELGVDLLVLRDAGLSLEAVEQRSVGGVHLTTEVVEDVDQHVPVGSAEGRSNGAGSLR